MSASTPVSLPALLLAWNAHDLEHVLEFYDASYVGWDNARAGPQKGLPGLRRCIPAYRRSFPDLTFTPEASFFEGDRAACFWEASGTHAGPFLNIPPTSHRVTVKGATLFSFRNGKIVHARATWDLAGLLRTLRLLPEL
jgi:steroid delta-isomerase-like uncharacterized protein